MSQEEHILVVILNLKLQCWGLIYVIMVMHTYLLRGDAPAARQTDEKDKGVTLIQT